MKWKILLEIEWELGAKIFINSWCWCIDPFWFAFVHRNVYTIQPRFESVRSWNFRIFLWNNLFVPKKNVKKRLHLSEAICELKMPSRIQPKFGKRTNFIPGKRVSTKVLQSGKRIYGHSNPFIVNRKDRPIASTMHMNWKALTNSQKS